ncbi:IstB-like ATP-binding domain-containing protein [Candidatus Magnetobacterium casensis]|uniref:IstB-like ATP-binding domain-containing protein n=1 Tax=Candidatus Magnetobacterium casense TaxID=1455061 RepID=A0ABS6S2V4_9BACT|nr:ATP-binding protein [Candidatus Magnetobacterium casensis]MBV6343169.1 IstB-like ATP-binding domain-containing protein [Candidatus Magnetobacterium casensis]
MLPIPTLEKLKALKLYGMTRGFEEQAASSEYQNLTFDERLGLLVDREKSERENRQLKSRLRQAKLRHQACMEDIDYQHPRGLTNPCCSHYQVVSGSEITSMFSSSDQPAWGKALLPVLWPIEPALKVSRCSTSEPHGYFLIFAWPREMVAIVSS